MKAGAFLLLAVIGVEGTPAPQGNPFGPSGNFGQTTGGIVSPFGSYGPCDVRQLVSELISLDPRYRGPNTPWNGSPPNGGLPFGGPNGALERILNKIQYYSWILQVPNPPCWDLDNNADTQGNPHPNAKNCRRNQQPQIGGNNGPWGNNNGNGGNTGGPIGGGNPNGTNSNGQVNGPINQGPISGPINQGGFNPNGGPFGGNGGPFGGTGVQPQQNQCLTWNTGNCNGVQLTFGSISQGCQGNSMFIPGGNTIGFQNKLPNGGTTNCLACSHVPINDHVREVLKFCLQFKFYFRDTNRIDLTTFKRITNWIQFEAHIWPIPNRRGGIPF